MCADIKLTTFCFLTALWRGVGRTFSTRYKRGTGHYQLYNQWVRYYSGHRKAPCKL